MPEGKRPLRRQRHIWVITIKLDHRGIEWGVVDCIGLVQEWGELEGSCEHGNELSGSIKCWEIFEQLHNWWRYKTGLSLSGVSWYIQRYRCHTTQRHKLSNLCLVQCPPNGQMFQIKSVFRSYAPCDAYAFPEPVPFILLWSPFGYTSTATILKNGVIWDVTPCDSCKNRRFGGT
jgi:hypothetical protein